MKKQLFDYVILFHEYEVKDGKKEYKDTKIIKEKSSILAKDQNAVAFKATREITDEYAEFPEQVEIIVRPF